MNKIILHISTWYNSHKSDVNDMLTLIVLFLISNFIKIYREPASPNKWRPTRFISEFIISSLIGLSFYVVNSTWFHLPYPITLILCVWFGSLSTKIYNEFEESITWLFDTIKEAINSYLKKFLVVFAIFFIGLATGCAKKPVATSEQIKKEKEIVYIQKDSQTTKSLAILDSLKLTIENIKTSKSECDSITNAKIEELLQRLNTRKVSGNNSFGIYYDKLKRELVAYSNIGETQSQKIAQLEKTLSEKSNQKTITVPVKYIPKEVKYFAWFGLLALLYLLYKIIKPILLWVGKKQWPLA